MPNCTQCYCALTRATPDEGVRGYTSLAAPSSSGDISPRVGKLYVVCTIVSRCPPLTGNINPCSNQRQRPASAHHFEQRQRLVRLIRLRNQRQRDRERRGDQS